MVVALEASEPSRSAKRRLLDAVKLRASIRHPNLARARPLGWSDGRLVVDLDLPSCPTLAERLAAAPLEPAECVRILDGVAAGAAALQDRGLVPRSVTTGDVVVHPADGGVLMDLGIPPELLKPVAGEPDGPGTDARSRVYSLGAVLRTALTGEQRRRLGPELDRVIARATAADPADRYADLTELSRAASAALRARPAAVSAPSNGSDGRHRLGALSSLWSGAVSGAGRRCAALAGAAGERVTRLADRDWNWQRGLGSLQGAAVSVLTRGRPALVAGGAIAASVVAGTAIGGSVDVKRGPASVTRSGLTVQLPVGWKETKPDPAWSAISPALAAAPSDSNAGLVVGELSSLAAAERALGDLQRDGRGQAPVRLGSSYAWRYSDLRPRPRLAGLGYAVPTTAGAVVFVCHAPRNEPRVHLARCNRAATTLVIRGEESLPLSALSQSKERLIRVVAALRSTRSAARRRLAAADRPHEQVHAATALQRSYLRAARSLEGLPPLENGRPLDGVSAALRDAAAAYGSLAEAADSGSPSTYGQASHALILREEEVRRELAAASGA